jgi:large subunit ribosomal protein L7/L12
MADLPGMVDRLSALTVIEAAELAKMLEEKWGVSAAAPVQVIGQPGQNDAPPPEPEQSEFTVKLTSYGEQKVQVVKSIRGFTGLDLKSAMTLTNELGTVKTNVSKADAEAIKKSVEEAGGSVAIF